MKGKQKLNNYAVCPFYEKHDPQKIFCKCYNNYEAMPESCVLFFQKQVNCILFMEEYCESNFQSCPYYNSHELHGVRFGNDFIEIRKLIGLQSKRDRKSMEQK